MFPKRLLPATSVSRDREHRHNSSKHELFVTKQKPWLLRSVVVRLRHARTHTHAHHTHTPHPEFWMMMSPPRIHAPKSLFLKAISVSMTAATRGRPGSAFSCGRNLTKQGRYSSAGLQCLKKKKEMKKNVMDSDSGDQQWVQRQGKKFCQSLWWSFFVSNWE